MAGRPIKTPGATESQQPEEQTKTEQTPETEQQVSEPTYEDLKESLIHEQNKHSQFLNDPDLLEARLRELKPDLFTQQPSSELVTEKRQRMVLGKDGWTKESY
ncbi:MAG: hypothetical protein RSA84_22005 [Acinetobacter sp.]